MLDAAVLLGFCLFVGLLALVVCGWVVASGQLFALDGLLLTLVSLSIGGIFMANFAWSVHTGEFQQVLDYIRKRPGKTAAPAEPSREDQK